MTARTRQRAKKLVEKARSTAHAAEAKALLDKATEILAKEGATLVDLDAPAAKAPGIAVAKRPRRKMPAKPTPTAPVVVSGLIDESGSMSGVRQATIDGYNGFLDRLQAELGQTPSYVSTLLFDQSEGRPLVRPLAVGQPIAQAARLSAATYAPNGMTPLYDAIAETIRATDEVVAREKATRVFLVLQTDGGENASRDFAGEPGRAKIAAMLEERKQRGWQIVFLAADLADQGYRMGASLGLGAGQTISYGKTHTRQAFDVVAASASGYLRGAQAEVAFSAAQKAQAGDPTLDPGRPASPPAVGAAGAAWPHAVPSPGLRDGWIPDPGLGADGPRARVATLQAGGAAPKTVPRPVAPPRAKG